jgi:hypothetical protein
MHILMQTKEQRNPFDVGRSGSGMEIPPSCQIEPEVRVDIWDPPENGF